MPERMACLRIDEWGGELSRAETPVPSIGAGDVLIEVEATGVGRTVHNYVQGYMGDDPGDLPRIPGHELVGTVVETGAGVSHLDAGDRVTAFFHLVCGHCRPCLEGLDPLCENHAGWVGVDLDGGYAEYARLPAGQAIPIPASIDPVAATAIPDAIATPYHVTSRRAEVAPGDRVAVIGAGGGVGIHLVQVARYFGGSVTAIDIDDEKLQRCRDVGAERTINAADRAPDEALDAPAPGYDAVVDFVGDVDLLEAAVDALAPGGVVVNLTSFPDNYMELAPRSQVIGETEVVGSRYCSKYEIMDAAALVADGVVEPVVSEVVDFEEVADLLETVAANELVGRGAMRPV